MDPVERISDMLDDAKDLNEEVRAAQDIISLAQARRIIHLCREIEGWLKGVRELLE